MITPGTTLVLPDELCEDLYVCEQSRDARRVVVGEQPLGERLEQPEGGVLVAARRQQQEAGHVVEALTRGAGDSMHILEMFQLPKSCL